MPMAWQSQAIRRQDINCFCSSGGSYHSSVSDWSLLINTLRPRQNGRHFADDIFKRIFVNENIWIPIKISLNFFPKGSINNIPALVQIMAWRRPGDKPLSKAMMVNLPPHICVTRPQWVKMKKMKFDWMSLSWWNLTCEQLQIYFNC